MLTGVALTTVAWLGATFLAPLTARATLEAFVTRVRPGGPGWRSVTDQMAVADRPRDDGDLWVALVATLAASVATWAILFAVGLMLYGRSAASIAAVVAAAAGWLVVWSCWGRLSFR
jgi:SSS family solute:Na+ symporter